MIVTKYLASIALIAIWLAYVQLSKSKKFGLVSLFFVSIAAFSQNFELYFRNLHQVIQIPMILFGFIYLIQGKVSRASSLVFWFLFSSICLSIFLSEFDSDSRTQLTNFISSLGVTIFLLKIFWDLSYCHKYLFSTFMVRIGSFAAVAGIYESYALGVDRVEGTFANPNYFALFIGICYCFLFFRKLSVLDWVFASVMIFGIYLSGSRSAIFMPLFAHIWAIWKYEALRTRLQKVLFMCVAITFSYAFLLGVADREGADGSDAERIIFTRIGLDMAIDHPFTGVGWGRYPAMFSQYAQFTDSLILPDDSEFSVASQERRVSHNDFVRIFAELGIVAGTAFIVFVLLGAKLAFQTKSVLSPVMLPIIFGLILFSATHNNLNTAMTWFFLLIPFCAQADGRNQQVNTNLNQLR